MPDTTPKFGLFKDNETTPFFVGDETVVKHCLETLRNTFFFVAGNAKPVTEEFPFHMKPL